MNTGGLRRRRRRDTRDRIFTAATAEFARHGFAGTGVDRIASRARVNKAMIYYHFASKAALYRTILRGLFDDVLARVRRVADEPLAPDARLDGFISALAEAIVAHPHFPAIWLRELADGGRHLDAETFAVLARIPDVLRRILEDGRGEGAFGAVHPLLLHFTIVGPLIVHLASESVRARLGGRAGLPALTSDVVLAHVQRVARETAAHGVNSDEPTRRRSRLVPGPSPRRTERS